MSETICLDLEHLGLRSTIAAYVLLGDEPTVVDPGPTTALPRLLEELGRLGVGPGDLRHVVLTHVHLDHAGSTGELVTHFPQAVVHIHADGAPHMIDPTRLVVSTRRTFGDAHDRLWGTVRSVDAARIRPWRPGEPGPWPGLRPVHTPGHIVHHVAYLDERDGTLFSGDSMGVVLGSSAPTHPPTPPPAIDLRAWERTLDTISVVAPERFGATHFGLHGSVQTRVEQLRRKLAALEARVRAAVARRDDTDALRYEEEVRGEMAPYLGTSKMMRYFDMFAATTDYAGVRFYLERNP